MVRSFVGGEGLNVRGSVLVLKSDDIGGVVNLDEIDFPQIEKLVVL